MLRIVLCNCSPGESPYLAETLVKERLAACVNVVRGVTSYYEWDGEFKEESEHTLWIKTTAAAYPALKARLEEIHSYDVPEIVCLEPTDVLDRYMSWATEQTR